MFQWLILHTFLTAVLAGVVLAASRWFRLGPAARHLLWLVVLVKFLTPPVVYWPWALPTFSALPPVVAPSNSGVRTVVIDMAPDFGPEPVAEETLPLAPVVPAPVEERPAAPPFTWDLLPTALCWTWLAGGVLVALLQAKRVIHWRRLVRGAPAPDELEALVRELAGAMGIRPPRLVILSRIASPMVWCLGVPRLLWPSGLEDRLSAPGCRTVLLHELAHLRRRDHWVGWLVLAGGCVWWWHPLFWWVRRRLSQEAELACDAWVVSAAPDSRRAYAEALLEVSQRMSGAIAVPALGAAGTRRDLQRRLVMIMRGPASRRLSWLGLAGAIALGLLALPAWTLGEDKTAPHSDQPVPPTTTTEVPPTADAIATPREEKPVPTVLGPKAFCDGDKIEIIRVEATSPKLGQGDTLTVYFSARLASQDQAQLGLYLTQTEKDGSEGLDLSRSLKVNRGITSEYAFKMTIKHHGVLHLTFYDKSGKPFGGVYFGTTEQMKRIEKWSLDYYLAGNSQLTSRQPEDASIPPVAEPVETITRVITLERVAYKFKPGKAAALATFLKDNVKTAVLEIKTDGENLVVTTTPVAQPTIGQFIHTLRGLAVIPSKNKSGEEVITLTRASYKLKPATAEALSTILQENVMPAFLEIKINGESIVVTTIPDAQEAIGQIIHLLQGPTLKASGRIDPVLGNYGPDGKIDPVLRNVGRDGKIDPPLGDYSGPDSNR